MIKNLIPAEIKALLDGTIHDEIYASHLYRYLANQMQKLGLFGAQKFFMEESASEMEHYQLHVDFQNDQGAMAGVPAIQAMKDEVSGLEDALALAYETELDLLMTYQSVYGKCASSPVVQQFLLQFIEIQRKSVGEYADLIARCNIAEGDKCALLIIDKEMGA